MEMFRFLYQRSKGVFILAIVAGIIAGASGTYLVSLTHRAIRDYPYHLDIVIWSFAGALTVRFLAGVASRILIVRLGQDAVYELRTTIPKQVLEVPLRRLEQLGMNRLLAILTTDVHAIAQALVMVPTLLVGILTSLCAFGYLGYLSWKLLLFLVAIMAVGLFIYRLPAKIAMGHLHRARDQADDLMQHFQGTIEGVKELKIHGERQSDFLDHTLKPTADRYRKSHIFGMSLLGVSGNWGQLLVFVGIGFSLFLFAGMIGLERFVVMGYVLTVLFVATYIEGILSCLPVLGRAKASLKKVRDLTDWLEEDAESYEKPTGVAIKTDFGSIKLDHVTYTYPQSLARKRTPKRKKASGPLGILRALFSGSKKIKKKRPEHTPSGSEKPFGIGAISLEFKPGELVFLTGGNGSGKTTLIKLLSGLYHPETGRVLVDGKPVAKKDLDAYRRNFSVIYQEFYLFDSLLGLGQENDEQARRMLAQLQLDRKVDISDGRFSSTDLSRGQRKRLALLTAYLEDRPFYIFDEWAADQDPTFKDIFYNKILPELKARNKAVLVISHDDHYHHVADRILKMDYGKIEADQTKTLETSAV